MSAKIKLEAKDLKRNHALSKNDPFFKIHVGGHEVYKSEVKQNDSSPTWKSFTVNKVNRHDLSVPFRIDVYDDESDGKDDLLGSVITTLAEMVAAHEHDKGLKLVNVEKKKESVEYKHSGKVYVKKIKWDHD